MSPSPGPQAEIFQAFKELFQVACARPPPLGLCDYPSSRAVYAVDLMLKWDSRPDGEGAPQPRPVYPELILQPPHPRCHATPPGTERGRCCLGLVPAAPCPFSLISPEIWIRGGPSWSRVCRAEHKEEREVGGRSVRRGLMRKGALCARRGDPATH